jgi:hypothetical protein
MEQLHPRPKETASDLVQVFVELLWWAQCSHQIRRDRAENRPDKLTVATQVEHATVPS